MLMHWLISEEIDGQYTEIENGNRMSTFSSAKCHRIN